MNAIDSKKLILKKQRQKAGRKKIDINWDRVDEFLVAGCTGHQTAAAIGIHEQTLYDRCLQDKGLYFTDYLAKKKSKGNSMLHMKQFSLAMAGDKIMLLWLGKQRLDQREPEPKSTELYKSAIEEYLKILKESKKQQT